jgi:hypothetical protein
MPPRMTAPQIAALREMQARRDRYLSLGELPRGVGQGIMLQLTRQGLVESGQSERCGCREGWRITLDSLRNLNEVPASGAASC